MHFAARLLVGESVREPIGYYRANVGGTLSVLEAMAEAGVGRLVFSSTCATFGEPQTTHDRRDASAAADQCLRRDEAGRSSGRSRTSSARTGIRSVTLRYFNAAGADPDGLIGEDHEPEEHLIPLAIAAACGGKPLTVFGDDYADAGRHLRARLRARVRPGRRARGRRCRRLEAGGRVGAYNLGTGPACRCGR